MGGVEEEGKKHSPSLHLRCASARAFPANLGWGKTRYNESMRDHNHRICCYLNCSVSYLKNAHRYHEKYLMRAMTMTPMMLCRTRGSVWAVDDSRCVRRGMIALKVTFWRERIKSFASSTVWLSERAMTMMCSVRRKIAKQKRGRKNYRFSPFSFVEGFFLLFISS